ncbi:MAG: hypothetical protein IJA72_02835, partial [Clostridia bacterium]|nr:hypothetical protein [Clostridia bacterium]
MISNTVKDKIFYTALALIAVCASLAHLNIVFQILLYAIVILAPLLLNSTKTISLYCFSACFMACFGGSWFIMILNVSLALFWAKEVVLAVKNKNCDIKNIILLLLLWGGLLLILTLYSLFYNKFKVYRMIMFVDFVQFCFIFYLVHKTINLKHVLLTLTSGIASSVLIAVIFQVCGIYSGFIQGDLTSRFGAFFNNINTLSVFCTTCASCLVALILTNQLEFKKFCWMPFVISGLGFLSMSKVFMILTILLYLSWYTISFIKSANKRNYIWYTIILVLLLLAVIFVFRNYIHRIINRFIDSSYSSKIDNFTTGRASIWKEYIRRWLESPITVLFGNGYTAQKISTNFYEHSIYIAFLFQFGVVGTILIMGLLIWSMCKAKFSRNIANYIPVALLLINGLTSNLSGILCPCIIWLLAFCFVTNKTTTPNLSSQNIA